jgi:hypothetical protein
VPQIQAGKRRDELSYTGAMGCCGTQAGASSSSDRDSVLGPRGESSSLTVSRGTLARIEQMQLAGHLVTASVVGNKGETFNSEQLCSMYSEI